MLMLVRYLREITHNKPWLQLFLFATITLLSLMLGSAAGYLIPLITDGATNVSLALEFLSAPEKMTDAASQPDGLVRILAITQISAQIGLFIMPPLVFAMLIYGQRFHKGLGLDATPGAFSILLVIPLTFMVLPMVSWLHQLNMQVPITETMELSEQRAELFITLFLKDDTWKRLVLNLFMIALLPAIGEELFFRGILQKYLAKGLKNVHLAVFVTAILFSLLHFQFHGFLPRVFLGVLFGYLFVWTGNLWLPIIAHFVNNGAAVVVEFLGQRGLMEGGYQEFGKETGTGALALSIAVTFTICLALYYHHLKNRIHPPMNPSD